MCLVAESLGSYERYDRDTLEAARLRSVSLLRSHRPGGTLRLPFSFLLKAQWAANYLKLNHRTLDRFIYS
jgi:hypothetical protein